MAGDETATPEPEVLVAEAHVEVPQVASNEPFDVKSEIARVFGSLSHEALCIAQMESGYRADATNYNQWNGTWDVGVFQINDVHNMSWDDRMNPRLNIARAKEIRDSWGSWRAWVAAPKCGL